MARETYQNHTRMSRWMRSVGFENGILARVRCPLESRIHAMIRMEFTLQVA